MTKRLLITLSIFALFASCTTRRTAVQVQNPATFDEGVVINGVRWATRNVGAPGTFVQNPEDAGMFFQWNRLYGWRATLHYTDRETTCRREAYAPTQRWNPAIGTNGGWENADWDSSLPIQTAWYAENDPCPEGWRVPTYDELDTLFELSWTDSEWTTLNGVKGRFFGTYPYQIFLPALGLRRMYDGMLHEDGNGVYWSSTHNVATSAFHIIIFESEARGSGWHIGSSHQAGGRSVRCVSK